MPHFSLSSPGPICYISRHGRQKDNVGRAFGACAPRRGGAPHGRHRRTGQAQRRVQLPERGAPLDAFHLPHPPRVHGRDGAHRDRQGRRRIPRRHTRRHGCAQRDRQDRPPGGAAQRPRRTSAEPQARSGDGQERRGGCRTAGRRHAPFAGRLQELRVCGLCDRRRVEPRSRARVPPRAGEGGIRRKDVRRRPLRGQDLRQGGLRPMARGAAEAVWTPRRLRRPRLRDHGRLPRGRHQGARRDRHTWSEQRPSPLRERRSQAIVRAARLQGGGATRRRSP